MQELERIKMQTREPEAPSSQLERQRLKKLSDERAQKWPNTIEALRSVKVSTRGPHELVQGDEQGNGWREDGRAGTLMDQVV